MSTGQSPKRPVQAPKRRNEPRKPKSRTPAPPTRSTGTGLAGVAGSRTLLLGAVVLVLAVAAAVVVTLQLTGDDAGEVSAQTALPLSEEVNQIFEGVPQEGMVLGDPDAPVTVVEYADLQCPFCAQFAAAAVEDIVQDYVREGQAKLELRPLTFIGPDSEKAARAVVAAGGQGKAWNLSHLMYVNQGPENAGWVTDDYLAAAAKGIPGLDASQMFDAMDADFVSEELEESANQAQADGVQSTPTILVGPSGGQLERVEMTELAAEPVAAAIEEVLAAER